MDELDLFSDSISLFGDLPVPNDDRIIYGNLVLSVARKEGKACTLLADQLFSPSFALVEFIETGRLDCRDKCWIEIGAGSGFVSLCAAISKNPPKLVLVTDYPDDIILGNLKSSVNTNRHLIPNTCEVQVDGYAWASESKHLIDAIPDPVATSTTADNGVGMGGVRSKGFDVMIMSDLLYFDQSHDDLIRSIQDLLTRSVEARVYVAAGKYTSATVCQSFLDKGERVGLHWEEVSITEKWEGVDPIGTYTVDDLERRKQNSRLWIGRWDVPKI